ncbi:MAG: hypothetical protein J6W82_03935 [Bacteroidales bacterium]|nr:hypothetical protein [Bacteroidales bacterium]
MENLLIILLNNLYGVHLFLPERKTNFETSQAENNIHIIQFILMEVKELYAAPAAKVLLIRVEGVICQSGYGANSIESGTLDDWNVDL